MGTYNSAKLITIFQNHNLKSKTLQINLRDTQKYNSEKA